MVILTGQKKKKQKILNYHSHLVLGTLHPCASVLLRVHICPLFLMMFTSV